jgi:DNA-binding Lrp family transcriptional regulator
MAPSPKLDRIDLKILAELQRDGQLMNIQLAERVGLSPSPCLQRVKRLESAGFITGYGANLNISKLVENITVFTEVTLTDHRREDFVRFEASLRAVDELMECHLISGGYDYLLRFIVRNVAHYQEVIDTLVNRNVGISKYFSYIVLKSPLLRTAAPIDALLSAQER